MRVFKEEEEEEEEKACTFSSHLEQHSFFFFFFNSKELTHILSVDKPCCAHLLCFASMNVDIFSILDENSIICVK